MSKHTPGPWSIHEMNRDQEPFLVTPENGADSWMAMSRYVGKGEKLICDVAMMTGEGGGYPRVDNFGECIANARLISAAPEGLDAAILAYEILADIRHQWKGRETPEGQIALVSLRDFIAKATGREAQDVQDEFTNLRISKAA